ncbi:uncharacterized protein [Haliotis cracherodii]|uniref:uncharacterized protein n=1 Tax=Haliotis cracherodii TaxID=6455 RepID=UPI0039E8E002
MVHGIKGLMYDISKLNIHATLQEVNRALFPDMKVVVTVSRRRLARLMSQVDMFDEGSNRTTDFRHHSQWLLLTTGDDLKQLNITQLENVAAILTDKLTYHNCEAKLTASWLLTLRHHHQTSLFTAVSDCGASYKEACIFPNTAYGYNGRQVVVSILGTPFYVYKDIVNGTATFTGYCMDILEAIGRKLNFSFHVTEPADMTWGFIENRKWNGLVGQLHRREVDMVASDLTVHEGRAKVLDYIFPMIKTDALVILYKEPTGTEKSFFLLTRPLSPIVNVVYLSVVLILPVIMLLLESVKPNSGNRQKTRKASRVRRCLGIGWDIVGSLFKQESLYEH